LRLAAEQARGERAAAEQAKALLAAAEVAAATTDELRGGLQGQAAAVEQVRAEQAEQRCEQQAQREQRREERASEAAAAAELERWRAAAALEAARRAWTSPAPSYDRAA
jgi:hypothetical protein